MVKLSQHGCGMIIRMITMVVMTMTMSYDGGYNDYGEKNDGTPNNTYEHL